MIRRGAAKYVFLLVLAAFPVVTSVGCFLDDYWSSGRYKLWAIDDYRNMDLVFYIGDGAGIGLVGPTVFSIGADDRYVVVKQHPRQDYFSAPDRTVTNYFVVERTASSSPVVAQELVQGPLTEEEYEELEKELSLPEFSKSFRRLE